MIFNTDMEQVVEIIKFVPVGGRGPTILYS